MAYVLHLDGICATDGQECYLECLIELMCYFSNLLDTFCIVDDDECVCVFQEVVLACNILTKEASRMSASLGELLVVPLFPGHTGICPPITESQQTSRRVLISCSQSEDLFWPVDTISFVIDTGVEKRLVSVLKIMFFFSPKN